MGNLFAFAQKPTILLVDDTPDNITLLSALLKDKYKLKIATNGVKALQIAHAAPAPDLILLDVMMPEMDGHETCRRLKADPQTSDIPVIFLTSRTRPEDEEFGLSLGAADYIMKPISPPIVLARVATQLQLQRARQLLRSEETEARPEQRDSGALAGRMQAYTQALGERLREHPRFSRIFADENIGLAARLTAVVGAYDALVSRETGCSHEEAVRLMREGASHFDPDVLHAFLHIEGTFRAIAQQDQQVGSAAVQQSAA
ncbi:response regulator [Noviherbaspirillum sp. ST9]|uniref:response regulator n=1 Tax=Noviherbaspirillum sp. ST9 TaxID=3401606 RepID=UPI003B58A6A2